MDGADHRSVASSIEGITVSSAAASESMSQKTVFLGSAFVVPRNHHACVIADDDERRRDYVARF